jgi:hypothetical protein
MVAGDIRPHLQNLCNNKTIKTECHHYHQMYQPFIGKKWLSLEKSTTTDWKTPLSRYHSYNVRCNYWITMQYYCRDHAIVPDSDIINNIVMQTNREANTRMRERNEEQRDEWKPLTDNEVLALCDLCIFGRSL